MAGSPCPDGTTSVVAPVSDPYSISERTYHQPASSGNDPERDRRGAQRPRGGARATRAPARRRRARPAAAARARSTSRAARGRSRRRARPPGRRAGAVRSMNSISASAAGVSGRDRDVVRHDPRQEGDHRLQRDDRRDRELQPFAPEHLRGQQPGEEDRQRRRSRSSPIARPRSRVNGEASPSSPFTAAPTA